MIDALGYYFALMTPREQLTLFACVGALLVTLHTGIAEMIGAFWEYVNRHFGSEFGTLTGGLAFAALWASLCVLCLVGFVGDVAWVRGFLVGLMFADAWLSHIGLRLRFEGPNPGLFTSLLYLPFVAATCAAFDTPLVWVLLGTLPFAGFWCVAFALRWYGLASGLLVVIPKRKG